MIKKILKLLGIYIGAFVGCILGAYIIIFILDTFLTTNPATVEGALPGAQAEVSFRLIYRLSTCLPPIFAIGLSLILSFLFNRQFHNVSNPSYKWGYFLSASSFLFSFSAYFTFLLEAANSCVGEEFILFLFLTPFTLMVSYFTLKRERWAFILNSILFPINFLFAFKFLAEDFFRNTNLLSSQSWITVIGVIIFTSVFWIFSWKYIQRQFR